MEAENTAGTEVRVSEVAKHRLNAGAFVGERRRFIHMRQTFGDAGQITSRLFGYTTQSITKRLRLNDTDRLSINEECVVGWSSFQ